MKQELIKFYLDWVNNYLTIQKMSDDYGFTWEQTDCLIQIGRQLHESNVLLYKESKQTT
jgi:hypothetical protein